MPELTVGALSATDKARLGIKPNVHTLAAQPRTKDQCQMAMMRFSPACPAHEVIGLLKGAGYQLERTNDGVIWIQPPQPPTEAA